MWLLFKKESHSSILLLFTKEPLQSKFCKYQLSKKIAYLYFEHGNKNVIDKRLLSANSRVVEVHFNSIGALMFTCLKNNANRKAIYQQVRI